MRSALGSAAAMLAASSCSSDTPAPKDTPPNAAARGNETIALRGGPLVGIDCSDLSVDLDGDGVIESTPSAARTPDIRVQIAIMDCPALAGVEHRLKTIVVPSLREMFRRAPMASPCRDFCGVELVLQWQHVACTTAVRAEDFEAGAGFEQPKPGFRHVTWAHTLKDGGRDTVGLAEDARAIVALGLVYEENRRSEDELARLELNTLTHELGHTLGLQHGSPDCSDSEIEDLSCTRLPHHASVMNYAWSLWGVGNGPPDPAGNPGGYAPLFQSFDAGPLAERHMAKIEISSTASERCASASVDGPKAWARYFSDGTVRTGPIERVLHGGASPVDFNGDGKTTTLHAVIDEWEWIETHGLAPGGEHLAWFIVPRSVAQFAQEVGLDGRIFAPAVPARLRPMELGIADVLRSVPD